MSISSTASVRMKDGRAMVGMKRYSLYRLQMTMEIRAVDSAAFLPFLIAEY